MLSEYRTRDMLNELFIIISQLLLEKISLEQFAGMVERLADEKLGYKDRRQG